MLKYSFKCFDDDDVLKISCVVPADQLFQFLDEFSKKYICKAYILDDDTEVK